MAHLFSRLFKKREMSNCNHPPSALHDFSQYDKPGSRIVSEQNYKYQHQRRCNDYDRQIHLQNRVRATE